MKRLMILLFAVVALVACAPSAPERIVETGTVAVTKVMVEVTKIIESPTEVVATLTSKEVPVTPIPLPVSEQGAIGLAEEIIAKKYPEFVGAERQTSSASVKGLQFWVVTYFKTVQIEGRTGPVDFIRTVVISVDKDTGKVSEAESD